MQTCLIIIHVKIFLHACIMFVEKNFQHFYSSLFYDFEKFRVQCYNSLTAGGEKS